MHHGSYGIGKGGFDGTALLAWTVVGLPIAWGDWITRRSRSRCSAEQGCPAAFWARIGKPLRAFHERRRAGTAMHKTRTN